MKAIRNTSFVVFFVTLLAFGMAPRVRAEWGDYGNCDGGIVTLGCTHSVGCGNTDPCDGFSDDDGSACDTFCALCGMAGGAGNHLTCHSNGSTGGCGADPNCHYYEYEFSCGCQLLPEE